MADLLMVLDEAASSKKISAGHPPTNDKNTNTWKVYIKQTTDENKTRIQPAHCVR